jgi:hypothetical protein
VGHLEANGFRVTLKKVTESQLLAVKEKYGVPMSLYSCHTALVQGYVIEGHVPADLIKGLLKDKPPLAGLGVPGMPIGSPGMLGPNPQPYEVIAFDRNGRMQVHARR